MGQAEDFITAKQVSTATITLTQFSEENALRFDHTEPRGEGETLTKLFQNSLRAQVPKSVQQ